MLAAEIIIYAIEIYLLIGVLFAVWFVLFGIAKLDESAKNSGYGFRLIIFFGAIALWLLLVWRLFKGEKRPLEKNAHRQNSSEAK